MKNKDIIVAVDFSEASKAALREAGHIAHLRQSYLNVIHVINVEFFERELDEKFLTVDTLKRQAEDALQKLTLETLDAPPSLRFIVLVGHPFEELLTQMKSLQCDLLVLGSYGNSGKADHIGTTAARFVRKAPIPVLLVREKQRSPFKEIVVCYDFSDTSKKALDYAAELAHVHRARLHIFHIHIYRPQPYVWVPGEGGMLPETFYSESIPTLEKNLTELIPPLKRLYPELEIVPILQRGSSASGQICEYVKEINADLTVLGTRGRTGIRKLLLGTVAEKIIHKCPSSVLAVKPADFAE